MLQRLLPLAAALALPAVAGRITVPLDGTWEVADSVAPAPIPAAFDHRAPVPGLAKLAEPPFPDVDRYDSAAVVSKRIRRGMLPPSAMPAGRGVSRQKRNYFWYRRRFRIPEKRSVAILQINKAQFGTAVWVNGKPAGEHLSCFTAGSFDVTDLVDWEGENTLLVRIGAHPGVLPDEIPAGDDFEKNRWTPGIYDSVALHLMDTPVIEWIQVGPRIQTSEIVVQTRLRNYGPEGAFELVHRVRTWKGGRQVTETRPLTIHLAAGAERTVTQTIAIPRMRLWSPEDPFLYVLETSSGGDSVATRFGMREFRFDTATKRAYLNGKVYFLRGSNITLHRFFEDPDCGRLPWDEKWVRRLLAEIPKKMHWNSFRFCIGPVPQMWLDIADEAGLLIQNEYFIWTGHPNRSGMFQKSYPADVLIREYTAWMRDNWNHPSVVIWDANNESYDDVFAERVIPAVRGLDLSNRPWENSYNLPAGPDDPVEEHPYLFIRNQHKDRTGFSMTMLEKMSSRGKSGHTPSAHAAVCNEYGWLWLNRDGTPTLLTREVYRKLLGDDATPEERFRTGAYLLAGLTEFWRAWRNYAGVLHFVYLTSSDPEAFTSDHFLDVKALELEPHFADYVGEAFKPVGVYINFWQPALPAGEERDYHVMVVNDLDRRVTGRLRLAFQAPDGAELEVAQQPLDLAPLGQRTYKFRLRAPAARGEVELRATAIQTAGDRTVSRRRLRLR